jgi:lipopolysaccharide/colanic/teichoic acid biosynthesis glycosyltransferase
VEALRQEHGPHDELSRNGPGRPRHLGRGRVRHGRVLVLGHEVPEPLRGQKDVLLVDPEASFPVPDPDDESTLVTLNLPTVTPAVVDSVRRLLEAGVGITSVRHLAKSRYRIASLEGPIEVPRRAALLARLLSRTLDIVVAGIGCFLLLPIVPLVALALWLDDRGPVFFRQERLGRGRRPFTIVKFRTMRSNAESSGARWAEAHDDRVTRVGWVLRRYRIDELPQFWNVLWGSMSLIGPRPERPEFVTLLEEHIPRYDVRHSIRPGMTGWGTVNVGYGNSVGTKYLTHQYDMFHLLHRTMRFDLEIIARTAKLVLTSPSKIDHHHS